MLIDWNVHRKGRKEIYRYKLYDLAGPTYADIQLRPVMGQRVGGLQSARPG